MAELWGPDGTGSKTPDYGKVDMSAERIPMTEKRLKDIRARSSDIIELLLHIEALGWQPIDSAPQGGIPIDLWFEGERYTDCLWGRGNNSNPFPENGYFSVDPDGLCVCIPSPSHWMPLPTPPEDTKEVQG